MAGNRLEANESDLCEWKSNVTDDIESEIFELRLDIVELDRKHSEVSFYNSIVFLTP